MGRQCLELMARKSTNLAVAVDVPTAVEMLRIADQARAASCLSRLALLKAARFVNVGQA